MIEASRTHYIPSPRESVARFQLARLAWVLKMRTCSGNRCAKDLTDRAIVYLVREAERAGASPAAHLLIDLYNRNMYNRKE